MSIWTDNADAFAGRDRQAHADQTLTLACREAAAIFRSGRKHDDEEWARHDARIVLERATYSADRVLGPKKAAS